MVVATLLGGISACGLSSVGVAPSNDAGGPDATTDVIVHDAADASDGDATMVMEADDVATEGSDVVATEGGDGGDATCIGVICQGACTPQLDCRSCPGAPLLCGPTGACASTCTACSDPQDASLPIQCFACDMNHTNPLGTCQYDDASAYCLSGTASPHAYVDGGPSYSCGCDDGGACPGSTQVCAPLGAGQFCFTCGENTTATLDGGACQGGGSCNTGAHTCN
jgi:hypothetical protein